MPRARRFGTDPDRTSSRSRDLEAGRELERVLVPTVQGDRRTPCYAILIGPDPDNSGFMLVRTDRPVMGEHLHSIETTDITRTADIPEITERSV